MTMKKIKIGLIALLITVMVFIAGLWILQSRQIQELPTQSKGLLDNIDSRNDKITKQEALKINISKPQQILPNTFKVIIEIKATDYTVSKVDGFDIIKIEEADEIHVDGEPIIPKIKYIHIPLPKNSSNIKLSMVQNISAPIGYYNIPCARALHYGQGGSALTTCTNLIKLYPTPPYWFHISDFDDYRNVAIGSALIQYNPQTKETIFYTYMKLEFIYEIL